MKYHVGEVSALTTGKWPQPEGKLVPQVDLRKIRLSAILTVIISKPVQKK